MNKIRIGPAGIPMNSKGKSTEEAVADVRILGLQAMEVEFVRGVYMKNELAGKVKEVAKRHDVELSVHAPYFTNLLSEEKEKVVATKKRIIDSAEKLHLMSGGVVVFHPAYYGKLDKKTAYERVKKECEDMLEIFKKNKWQVVLGLETTGKVKQWGTLDETVQLSQELKGVIPVVDFAHIYARQAGRIDYGEIFDKISVLKLDKMHTHFSCIEYSAVGNTGAGNERYHLPLSEKKPDFTPLVKEILKRKINITLICESPLLDQDALVLKRLFEKEGYKF